MARRTIADVEAELGARIEALEAEVEALKQAAPKIDYVREVKPQGPISTPIDFGVLWWERSSAYAAYADDEETWSPHGYL